MSYLVNKFKGQYRLRVPCNQHTNDFSRKLDGSYEDIDMYIDCKYGMKVFHFGRDILQAYIPSLLRGKNILKQIPSEKIFNIEETDSEILFRFKYSDSDEIIPLLKPKTAGCTISPFSTRNLPKNKNFTIPDDDLKAYKEIVSKIPKEHILNLTYMTNEFLRKINKSWEDTKADMKLKALRGKDYIYYIGKWNEYIKFLTENNKLYE